MNPLPKGLLQEAACWRLLSLLFERPADGWRAQVEALSAEVPDGALREAAGAALREATESMYCSLFGPGGPAPAREASCRPGIQLGHLLAEITGIYQAFGYRYAAGEPPDHIAVETGFVAYLKLKQVYAGCSGAAEEAQRCAEAVEYFLSRRLSVLAFAAREALEKVGPPYLTLAATALCERTGAPPDGHPLDFSGLAGDEPAGEFACGDSGSVEQDFISVTDIEDAHGTV